MRETKHTPQEKLMTLLIRAQYRIDCEVDEILKKNKIEIKTQHWHVLKHLDSQTGMSMKEIHTLAAINDSTLTKIIDKLVDKGLAFRRPSNEDRRKVLVFISRKGRTLFDRLNTQVQERQNELMPVVSQKELGNVTDYLSQIIE